VIRQVDITTATYRYIAEIGTNNGVIQVICKDLAAGHAEIGAAGRLMTPGGIDERCYLDQPMKDGSKMIDEFLSGTRSAAFGGATMMIPFKY